MKVYPSWRYHKTHQPKVIYSADEDLSLGEEWADSPAKFEGIKEDNSLAEGQGGPTKPKAYRDHMSEWESKEEKDHKEEKPKPKRGKR